MDFRSCFGAFLLPFICVTSTETHSLQYFYTAVRKVNFPEFTAVGLVDGEQIVYYDSNNMMLIPMTEWMQNMNNSDPGYCISEGQRMLSDQNHQKKLFSTVMKSFNLTQENHTLQRMYGCDDNSTTRGFDQYGYDGEDFISLDLRNKTWIAANSKAVITKHAWEAENYNMKRKNYLEKECISWLKKYVSYGRETLQRKDRPEASVFHKHFPRPELVCHATGFFPKQINITWLKDGEDIDVNPSDTLSNQDGSFQKRAVLRVSPEELKEHEYTCVVQHSSLEKDLVLKAPDRPEVSVFYNHSNSSELVCHATGFFPKEINMTWEKDGKKMNVTPNDTLPNQNGSFQKRAVLRVSPEELKEHEYTCVVQHSSLEKDVVLKAPGGPPIGIIIGAVVAVLALVAGLLIWKKQKKKSGNRTNNPKSDLPSTEMDPLNQ